MAENKKPGRLTWLWKLTHLDHKHPPPRSALSQPQYTLGGPAHTPMPAATPARTPASALPKPEKDPARQKLEEQAERRRDQMRLDHERSRRGLSREQAAEAQQRRERFDENGVVGPQRKMIEKSLDDQYYEQTLMHEDHLNRAWQELEAEIAVAFDVGYFSDSLAAAEQRSEARGIERGAGDGGRERE